VLVAAGLATALSCASSTRPMAASAPTGPYAAGTTTVSLPGGSQVQLWYPAPPSSARGQARSAYDIRDWLPAALARRVTPGVFTFTTDAYRNLPAAPSGPFPLVLFAHGLNSFGDQSTFLTTWLASWGYVVAAPDFPADDLSAFFANLGKARPLLPTDVQVLADTEQLVRQLNFRPGNPIAGAVKPGPVAIIGHSQGGIDAMQFAARPQVATYVALAAGFLGAHPQLPSIPSLYLAGSADRAILPQWVRAVYATAPQPKRLVVLAHAGHLAFTDLCLIGAGHGGLAALGRQLGLQLPAGAPFTAPALDGCGPGHLSPAQGFAQIRAAVLAQLRATLGLG
jgi:dienelactone hydrolase